MEPPSCPTHPPPTPGVDYLTCKSAWDLLHESFEYLISIGTVPVIERQVFRQHPKRNGDFSETLEVRIGKRLIKVDVEFVLEKGLRLTVLEEGSKKIIQDEWFTQKSQYEKQQHLLFGVVAGSMHESWSHILDDELAKPYFAELLRFVATERESHKVYPPKGKVFTAFEVTPFDKVRVVILGQDPYPSPGHAHGLSFSVPIGVRPPKSLVNIYKELQSDLGLAPVGHGSLMRWAEQGVFLLNTVLTVRGGEPGSHRGKGWERFTNKVIKLLSEREGRIVFLLWGKDAQSFAPMIDTSEHRVIISAHPSPFSANQGFFGSKPFSQANEALVKKGFSPIDWDLSSRPHQESSNAH